MRRGVAGLIALACAAHSMGLSAQEFGSDPAAARCLSLDQAIELALTRSPEIQLANADRNRAEADLADARSVTRPQVSTFLRTQAGDNNLTGAGVENSVGVRVSQRLFDFGTSGLERRSASLALEAREFDVMSARNETALETALALVGYAEVESQIAVTRERETFFERERQATADALELGGATLSELAEVSARFADAAADRLELEFQRDRFGAALSRRVGAAETPCLDALMAVAAADDPGIVESVERALGSNPRIQAADLQREAQELRAQRARRNRLPAIDLVGIASYAQDNFGNNDFGLRERIGIDVSIPLFSGGRLRADQQRANADRAARESDVRRLRLDLAERVEVAVRRISSLTRQLARRNEVVNRQDEQFAAAQIEFNEGLRTLPELVEDRLELEAARLNEVSTRFALLRETMELKALSNSLIPAGIGQDRSLYGPQ